MVFTGSTNGAEDVAPPAQLPESPVILTNAAQIAALSNNIPAGRYEARFRAVVIYVSRPSKRLYVQDGVVGAQINLTNWMAYREGSVVDISGPVLGGEGIPRLVNAQAAIVGDAPLPKLKSVSIHHLVAGHDTLRLVNVRGVVRDMFATKAGVVLLLTQDGYPFRLNIKLDRPIPLPRDWLDAELEVGGFAFPYFNAAGRLTSVEYYSSATNFVRVVAPGIADRFEGRPLMSIAEAAKLPNNLKPRIRVAGTVTVYRPGKSYYIDDGTGVMMVDVTLGYLKPPADADRIEREPQTPLQPGERVEVIGARHNWFAVAPSLMATEYRRLGHAEPIQPIPVTLAELQEGLYPGRLVTLTARIVDVRGWGSSNLRVYRAFVLRDERDVFQAKWESETPARWNLQNDQYVRITGVNDAEGGRERQRSTFEILLRGPDDVVPAPEPPFWAKREFQRIAAAVSGVIVLAGAWILLQRTHLRRLERRMEERNTDLRVANEKLQREVTQRSAAEENLRASEARKAAMLESALAHEKELSELKSRFVSMVSHEFRTPLGIIASSAEILDAYLDRLSPEERRANLHDITDATRHMSRMMEEVLLLGRVEAGRMTCRPEPTDLAVLGERLAEEVRSATGDRCPIRFTIAPGIGEARADAGLVRHIFSNLLNNASKYSPAGSPVEFRIEAREHLAIFTIRDRGIGIPEADSRALFQAFHRGRNVGDTPGTGLGMTIVKRCVDLHGGRIGFESREGHGTTFVVALPVFGSGDVQGADTIQLVRSSAATSNLTMVS